MTTFKSSLLSENAYNKKNMPFSEGCSTCTDQFKNCESRYQIQTCVSNGIYYIYANKNRIQLMQVSHLNSYLDILSIYSILIGFYTS